MRGVLAGQAGQPGAPLDDVVDVLRVQRAEQLAVPVDPAQQRALHGSASGDRGQRCPVDPGTDHRRRAPGSPPDVEVKAAAIQAALRTPALTQPAPVAAAFAAVTRALAGVIGALNAEITALQEQLAAQFTARPDAEIYRSQPGQGAVVAARVLAEFGDDPTATPLRARQNYAATSPITRQSGKKKTVHARFVHNDRIVDALNRQAQGALSGSPGARAYYDQLRARGIGHNAALRQLANRMVGILHGCLRTRTLYDEVTAWPHTAPGSVPDSTAA